MARLREIMYHIQHAMRLRCLVRCCDTVGMLTGSGPNNNNNDFISKALFHVKHAQLHCTMPMNNIHTRARARASKTSDERTIAYKSLKHNTIYVKTSEEKKTKQNKKQKKNTQTNKQKTAYKSTRHRIHKSMYT